jgi:hypothetical protein
LAPGEGGASLPPVFSAFVEKQISIRRAEVTMIAGQPGSGKSTLATKIALDSGVGTLYFSADTHSHTMALRLLAMITKRDQAEVEPAMDADPAWASSVLQRAEHIRWCFEPAPTLQDIEEEINCYREVVGADPELVVVDNLIDVTFDSGDEFSSLRALMRELKWWARDTGAAVLALHHMSEAYGADPCPPRAAIHGKVSQTPALILTVGSNMEGFLGVAPVKNRYGPASAAANIVAWLGYSPASMLLQDVGTP